MATDPERVPFFLGMTFDPSFWVLLAANLAVAGIGVYTGMGLAEMLLAYWIQSMMIGVCGVIRILTFKSEAVFDMDSADPAIHASRRRRVRAAQFAALYGLLHLLILVFLVRGGPSTGQIQGTDLFYAFCTVVFAANHGYSLYLNFRADAEGGAGDQDLWTLPFLRIVPMHFTMVVGNVMAHSLAATIFFLIFKTFVDVIMHGVEHKLMRRSSSREMYFS